MDMRKLVQAILARAMPGQGPGMEVPEASVMEGGPESSLGSFRQGGGRGALDIAGGAWDLPTQAANTMPGLPGLVLRTAMGGKGKLPTDAVAEATGLAGKGAAYDAGRSAVHALGALAGKQVNMEVPGPGSLNMWLAPLAPGYDGKAAQELKKMIQQMRGKRSDLLRDPVTLNHMANLKGMVWDPVGRVFLQPMPEVANWRADTDTFVKLRDNPGTPQPFTKVWDRSPGMEKFPQGVHHGTVEYDPNMPADFSASYTPGLRLIKLGPGAMTKGMAEFKSNLLHEGTHLGADVMKFASGTNPSEVNLVDQYLKNVHYSNRKNDLSQAMAKRMLSTGEIPPVLLKRQPYPKRFDDLLSKDVETPLEGYEKSFGEVLARESERMGKGLTPDMDPFKSFDYRYDTRYGNTPLGLADHLAEMKARHPQLYKNLFKAYPELGNLEFNRHLFEEMLGGRPEFGLRVKTPNHLLQDRHPKASPTVFPPPEINADLVLAQDPLGGRGVSASAPSKGKVFPKSSTEAEGLMGQGYQIFAVHEMGGGKIPITSPEMLQGYTPDQLYAVPPKGGGGLSLPAPKVKR